MRYEGDYGKNVVEAPTPDARPTFNGRRYETRQMTVDITRTPCSDGMSDRRYPDTVRVTTRRGTARGCGGLSNDRPGPGASLAGTSRSAEHTSELQSLMRISYAVFCLKKKKT